ncbi:MAG: tetratricopeptide repeat protein [Bacillota bacterium]
MLQLDYQLKKAADFEAQGKFLHAVQIYHTVISENPTYKIAYIRLATLYDRMNKLEASVNLLKKFIEAIEDDNDIRLFLGELFLKNSKWDEAIEVLASILTEEQPVVSFFLGYGFFMLKEFQISKIHFTNFLANNTNSEYHFETYIYLTKISIELEQYEDGLNYVKVAEKMFSNWETNQLTGIIYFNQSMYYHASISFEKAIRLNDKEPGLLEWAGKAYLKLGDFINAHKYLLKYVNSAEANAEAYTSLALACLNLQKTDEANTYFEMALALDPQNQVAIAGKKKCTK